MLNKSKISLILFFKIALFFFTCNNVYTQTDREFWFVAPEITSGHGNAPGGEPIYLKVSSLNLPSTVTIEQPANPSFAAITVNLAANATQTVDLTPFVGFIENYPENTVRNFGIHVTATELITAYYEVAEEFNNDIYAFKGKNALGTLFYAPMQNYWDSPNSYTPRPYCKIDIVATEDNTVVKVLPTAPVFGGYPAGDTIEVVLNLGQTYSVRAANRPAADHLGGTKIWVANSTFDNPRKIAVTVSDDSMYANPHGGCRDLNGDQIVPIDIIGKEYMFLSTGPGLNAGMDRAFVIATEDNTAIEIDGVPLGFNLNEGEIHQFEIINAAYRVTGDKKFYAYHVGGQQGCETGGAILPPIDKCTGSTQVGFTRSLQAPSFPFSMVMMVRDGAEGDFILNGDATIIGANVTWTDFPGDWTVGIYQNVPESVVATGVASLLENTSDLFHLGVVNGNSGTGGMYGYFSDFNELDPTAFVAGYSSNYYFICFGENQQLIATGGTDYAWTPGLTLNDSTISTPIAAPDSTTQYTVTVSGACNTAEDIDIFLFVGDSIKTNIAVDNPKGCSPHTVTLDPDSSYNITEFRYYWGDGTGDTIFNDFPISHTYNNTSTTPDTIDVMIVGVESGCNDTIFKELVIYPEITANFDVDTTLGCSPLSVIFTNNSINADYYFWEFGDGASSLDTNTTHTFENLFHVTDTNYLVSLYATSQYYCRDTADTIITVHPYIEAGFALDPVEACSPYNAAYVNSSHYAGNYAKYHWDFIGNSIIDDTFHTFDTAFYLYENNTNADIIFFPSMYLEDTITGCNDIFYDTLTVFRYVQASLNYDSAASSNITSISNDTIYGCHPMNIYLDGYTSSINSTGYSWDFGDGASSNDSISIHLFNNFSENDTVFEVVLEVDDRNRCFDYDTIYINVAANIKVGMSFTPRAECSPYEVEIYNSSVGQNTITSYIWNLSDTSFTDNVYQDYYYRTYTNTPNAVNTHPEDSIYPLSLRIENARGCYDEIFDTITVFPEVIAAFEPVPDIGCDSLEVSFTNNTLAASYYDWDFQNGTSSEFEPTQMFTNNDYSNSKDFIITLIAYDTVFRCIDVVRDTVTIFPFIKARLAIPEANVCAPYNMEFDEFSLGCDSIEISFGDGNDTIYKKQNINDIIPHTYNNTSTSIRKDTVKMVVWTESCSDSLSYVLTIYPEINAAFELTPTDSCSAMTVQFTNTSYPNTLVESYFWDFDDGHSSNTADPTFDYTFYNYSNTESDTFNISLLVTSDDLCTDTALRSVIVRPNPLADFSTENDPACSPVDVIFNNDCVGTLESDTLYVNFGDNTTRVFYGTNLATLDTLMHRYINTDTSFASYTVTWTLVTEDSCVDIISRNISIYPNIHADFSLTPYEGCSPHEVTFTNSSSGATAGVPYQWDYGDGTSSSNSNEFHTHSFTNFSNDTDSLYHVTLTAQSAYGCVDDTTLDVLVTFVPQADFELSDNPICSPDAIYLINKSTDSFDSLTINFLIDSISDVSDMVVYSPFDSIMISYELDHSISYTVEDSITLISYRGECSDTMKRAIRIYPYVEANISADVIADCSPHTVTFDGTGSTNAFVYNWDDNNSTDSIYSKTYYNTDNHNPLDYTVHLQVESAGGCTDTTSLEITVFPVPDALFNLSANEACAPYDLIVTNQSTPDSITYTWNYDYFGVNDSVSSANFTTTSYAPVTITYENGDTATLFQQIYLWAENGFGCVDTAKLNFNIHPHIVAGFTPDPLVGCSPLDVTFIGNSERATKHIWDFGLGNGQEEYLATYNPVRTFTNNTGFERTQTVSLIAKSNFGCSDSTSKEFTIYPTPEAAFAFDPPYLHYDNPPLTTQLLDQSTPISNHYSYKWIIEQEEGNYETVSGLNPTYTFPDGPPFYTRYPEVTQIVSYGSNPTCSDTIIDSIPIYAPKPIADFSPDTAGCLGGNGKMLVNFVSDSKYVKRHYWDFGDGNFVDIEYEGEGPHTEPHNYSKSNPSGYMVKLLVEGWEAEFDQAVHYVRIYNTPIALFSVEPTYVEIPEEAIVLTNNSSHSNDYIWDFGDGNLSYEVEPVYTYTEAGVYDITLVAINDKEVVQCYDTLTIQQAVTAEDVCMIKFPNAFTPDPSTASGGRYFPEDPTNDIFFPLWQGVQEYHLEIFNRWGELVFATTDVLQGWDGYYKGELAKQDVYVWKVNVKCTNGNKIQRVGDVMVIH